VAVVVLDDLGQWKAGDLVARVIDAIGIERAELAQTAIAVRGALSQRRADNPDRG
jgi:hypothetical protein